MHVPPVSLSPAPIVPSINVCLPAYLSISPPKDISRVLLKESAKYRKTEMNGTISEWVGGEGVGPGPLFRCFLH
jgi:hypothetical protein